MYMHKMPVFYAIRLLNGIQEVRSLILLSSIRNCKGSVAIRSPFFVRGAGSVQLAVAGLLRKRPLRTCSASTIESVVIGKNVVHVSRYTSHEARILLHGFCSPYWVILRNNVLRSISSNCAVRERCHPLAASAFRRYCASNWARAVSSGSVGRAVPWACFV